MSKNKKSKKSVVKAISDDIVPNKVAPAEKSPQTLSEFYAHYYKTLFNKLNKDEQEALLANLTKPNIMVRGEPVAYENVRKFVREVLEKSEEEFDKFVAKSTTNLNK